MFLDVDNNNDVFGNCLEFVLPRMMYLLDNNNFQTACYFKSFLHDDVFGDVFGEDRLFLDWRRFAGYWNVHLQHMQMHVDVDEFIFVFASAGICNNKLWRTMCMYARAWFKHVARQKLRESTTSTVASSLTTFFGCFVCVREKGESEVELQN